MMDKEVNLIRQQIESDISLAKFSFSGALLFLGAESAVLSTEHFRGSLEAVDVWNLKVSALAFGGSFLLSSFVICFSFWALSRISFIEYEPKACELKGLI